MLATAGGTLGRDRLERGGEGRSFGVMLGAAGAALLTVLEGFAAKSHDEV